MQSIDVMFFGSHPDDIEIGMGGTIASLTAAGKSVALVDLTDGEPTPAGDPITRMREAAEAAKLLGVNERRNAGLKNREVQDTVDNRKKVAAIIRELRPKVICLPYWEDAHPDHVASCALVEAARFYAKLTKTDIPHSPWFPERLLYFFGLHLRAKYIPAAIVDVTATFERKMESLACYRSQFVLNEKNANFLDELRRENAFWGAQIRRSFGEPIACREQLRINPVDISGL